MPGAGQIAEYALIAGLYPGMEGVLVACISWTHGKDQFVGDPFVAQQPAERHCARQALGLEGQAGGASFDMGGPTCGFSSILAPLCMP